MNSAVNPVDYNWLLGDWQRLNEEAGRRTFEHWERLHEDAFGGFSYTLLEGDTVQQERLQLKRIEDRWDLRVIAPGDEDWTYFKGIAHDSISFKCENTEIEFPNLIHYWIEGDHLKASVSGSDFELSFEFEPIQHP